MSNIIEKLEKFGIVETNKTFKELTTLKIGGKIKYLVYPENVIALIQVIDILKENKITYKVLGNGSNILCSDKDYDGCVVKLGRFINDCYIEDELMIVEAGASIIATANKAMKSSLTGLEFACGIPGTVGGCVFMNAGAYKKKISDILIEAFVLFDGECKWLKVDELEYSYRSSIFQKNPEWIILAVKFKLEKGNFDDIFNLMQERKARRIAAQPLNFPSAGSTFRNHSKYPAWKLIDGIGYRGKIVGGAKVSEKHVNFLINNGNATYNDFVALATNVQTKVKEQYDIDLMMEVEKFNC
jgi:UDP-N-acetylmuramate dehydrogenase